nr:beta-D-glucosyl crocetin beta-1,6-glucosyltransferase-like [Ipomoea batatas]
MASPRPFHAIFGASQDPIFKKLQPPPALHAGLPPHHHTTSALPPRLAATLQEAFQNTESTFYDVVSAINPDLLIYDGFQPWAASQAASLNIPAVHLSTAGAVAMSSLEHSRVDGARGSKFPFPEIYYHEHEIRKFISMAKKNPTGVDLGSLGFKSIEQSHKIMFINSCREMEGKGNKRGAKKLWVYAQELVILIAAVHSAPRLTFIIILKLNVISFLGLLLNTIAFVPLRVTLSLNHNEG